LDDKRLLTGRLEIQPLGRGAVFWATLVSCAFENTCAVLLVNVGAKAEDVFCRLSQVAMPLIGAVNERFDGSEFGMRVVEVDMEILEVAERPEGIWQRRIGIMGYSHVSMTISWKVTKSL
jgi:hypothetical protein